ncbi:MAG: hypothetical protein WCI67_04665 [Chloroflexales bacterium]
MSERQPITIRFRFNQDTGQIEELLIDDGDRAASEEYHNKIARAIAGRLFRRPLIEDAGIDSTEQIPATLTPEEIRHRQRERQ